MDCDMESDSEQESLLTKNEEENVSENTANEFDGVGHDKKKISSIEFSKNRIITGADDGKLRIYDLFTGNLVRQIQVNIDNRPILEVACIEEFDHLKIVVNTEGGLMVYEFSFKPSSYRERTEDLTPKFKRPPLLSRKQTQDTMKARELCKRMDKLTPEEVRLKNMAFHWSTLPSIRSSVNPTPYDEAVFANILVPGSKALPREKQEEMYHEVRKKELKNLWDKGVYPVPKVRPKLPKSYKDFLPITNPYKFYP